MNFIKKIIAKSLSYKVIIPSSSRIILVYHDVSNSDSPQYSELYSTTTAKFYEQIEFLKANFKLVSLDEIISSTATNQRMVAITFDDGFLSVKNEVSDYLFTNKIPFAIFVNQTAIKENFLPYDLYPEIAKHYDSQIFLNAEDIKYLYEKGVTVGSHSSSHRSFADCDAKMLAEEIGENKSFLEDLLKSEVPHLAIPYGKREHYNMAAIDYGKSVGHRYIYSTNPIYFSRAVAADLLIPRICLTNQTKEELCFLINRPMVKKIDI